MSPIAPDPQRQLSKRQLAFGLGMGLALLIPWLLTIVGLLLSVWILLPAPNLLLLPLGVGAPEVSPWLVGLNAIAALLALFHRHRGWGVAVAMSLGCLVMSALPLLQLPNAHQQMSQQMQFGLGEAVNQPYLSRVPGDLQAQMRSQPFVLADAFRGIAITPSRSPVAQEFARPDDVPLRLKVFPAPQTGLRPTIVVIHGGAWRNGSAENDAEFNRYLAAQGYTVIAITYRLAPRYRFPAQIEDVRSAFAYIRQHAVELGVDLERVALMGRSAGAHLAMLAAYQPSSLPIRAVVNYYGPVDLTIGYYDVPRPDPIDSRAVLRDLLGGTPEEFSDLYRQASPITYVTRPLPVTLLIYAGRDHLVQAKFGRGLYERLQAVGSQAVYLEIPWAEHAFDAVFNGVSNQLALYHTERFLAWALQSDS
jgi:acetyl esterase/lipase